MCNLGPANKGISNAETSSCHNKAQAAPGAEDRPAVAVLHISGQAVNQLREPVQIIGDAGRVRAEGNGAKYPCKYCKEKGMIGYSVACYEARVRQAFMKIRSTDEPVTPN